MGWLFKRPRTNSGDRPLALNFLRVLEWASARQQLALEEWNDALAAQATEPMGGDEIFSSPLVEINEAYAARLLPVAERRLASALLVRNEFAKLRAAEMDDLLVSAIDAWARVFEVHLRRCEKTARDLRALTAGTRLADNDDERRLLSEESQAMDEAVAAQGAVMEHWGIRFPELQKMMFAACNDVRLQIGKPKLSMTEYKSLYSRGMAGERPRFYA